MTSGRTFRPPQLLTDQNRAELAGIGFAPSFRYSLVLLFAGSAAWYVFYSVPLLNLFGDNSVSKLFSWAWSTRVASVFELLAPASWIGMFLAMTFGGRVQGIWGIVLSMLYVVSVGALIKKKASFPELPAILASALNTIGIGLQTLILAIAMFRSEPVSSDARHLGVMALTFAGHTFITCALLRALWRRIASQKVL